MKKHLNYAFYYAILAMITGVFYREFTKFIGFQGVTSLAKVHGHLFMLGMFMFLLIAVFVKLGALDKQLHFKTFMWTYNFGIIIASMMLLVRGVTQVLGLNLSRSCDFMISGIAGLGHILLGAGLLLLLTMLKKTFAEKSNS